MVAWVFWHTDTHRHKNGHGYFIDLLLITCKVWNTWDCLNHLFHLPTQLLFFVIPSPLSQAPLPKQMTECMLVWHSGTQLCVWGSEPVSLGKGNAVMYLDWQTKLPSKPKKHLCFYIYCLHHAWIAFYFM